MQEFETRRQHAALKELVVEASRALARLDADRLEELALSCQELNRNTAPADTEQGRERARQAREAKGDMAVFARVLEATRANLDVMTRLRDLRAGRMEYGERQARGWLPTESGHGDN
jgi:aminopeptidase N